MLSSFSCNAFIIFSFLVHASPNENHEIYINGHAVPCINTIDALNTIPLTITCSATQNNNIYIHHGKVYTEKGKVVPGATIMIWPHTIDADKQINLLHIPGMPINIYYKRFYSNAEGEYQLSTSDTEILSYTQNTKYYIIVCSPDYKSSTCIEMPADSVRKDIILKPAIKLSGVVVDDNGNPIARPRVKIFLEIKGSSAEIGCVSVSYENDQYLISGLPSGYKYEVQLTKDGYGNAVTDINLTHTKEKYHVLKPVILKNANSISGVVKDSYKKPVPLAIVLMRDGRMSQMTRTDLFGKFSFDKISNSPVTVDVDLPGTSLKGSLVTDAGKHDLSVTVKEPNDTMYEIVALSEMSGNIYDQKGAIVPGAQVEIISKGDNAYYTIANQNGKFKMDKYAFDRPTPDPNHSFLLLARQGAKNIAVIKKVKYSTSYIDINLKYGSYLSGSVIDSTGNFIKDVTVQLQIQSKFTKSLVTTTSEDGVYTIKGVPMGYKYKLIARKEGYLGAQVTNIDLIGSHGNIKLNPIILYK